MMDKKILLILTILAFMLPGVIAGTVTRSVSEVGDTLQVTLDVKVSSGDKMLAIEETYPDGWVVLSEGNGNNNLNLNRLTWVEIQSPASKTYTYTLKVPDGAKSVDFTGNFGFAAGQSISTLGNTRFEISDTGGTMKLLEICDNNLDDDKDGIKDCADPDCADDSVCNTVAVGAKCSLDSDCGPKGACEYGACLGGYPTACTSNYDCAQSKRYICIKSVCKQPKEYFCQDDIDNDGDGLADCEDTDCLTEGTCRQGADADGDGIFDADDNCPNHGNTNQIDRDNDGQGDSCDTDDDNDGVLDKRDNCMIISNADQLDTDSDQKGDACDHDDDGDKVADTKDNCPLVTNAGQADRDNDGLGDACDNEFMQEMENLYDENSNEFKQGMWARLVNAVTATFKGWFS